MLSLPEKLFILAIDEEKGAIVKSAKRSLAFAIVGAILAELTLQNKILINDKGRLEPVDSNATGDTILDPVLTIIQSSEKPRRLGFWISEIATKPKKTRQRIEDALVGKGILIREDDGFLGISTIAEGENKCSMKYQIKSDLRAAILAGKTGDLHSLAVLDLVRSSLLLNLVFTSDEIRLARRRIQELVIREALSNPTAQVIEEIDVAVSACLADA